MAVPNVFYFTCAGDEYLAEKQEDTCDGLWDVMWMDEHGIHYLSYTEDEIESFLNDGMWREVT